MVGHAGLQVDGLDKVVHICLFAGPVLAALMAGISARWALGILALQAPVSELIQQVALPRRSGDMFDVLADFSGIALGAAVCVVWSRRRS